MVSKSTTERFGALDGLRAYFIILTFFVHFVPNAVNFAGLKVEDSFFFGWLENSNYGVYGFFNLSGFLIGRMMFKSDFNWKSFLYHRFLRIYPAFFISALIAGGIATYYTGYLKISTADAIKNLFFLNGFFKIGEIPSLNFVTWSLFFEFVFYFSIPVIILVSKKLSASRAGSIVISLTVTWIISAALGLGGSYLLFFAGLWLASFSNQELKVLGAQMPDYLVLLFYLLVTSAYSLRLENQLFPFIYFFTSSLLIIKANYGDGFLSKLFNLPILQKLGKISYSFYLMHACVIIAYFFFLTKNFMIEHRGLTALLALPITFFVTYLVSLALYFIAERPYLVWRANSTKHVR